MATIYKTILSDADKDVEWPGLPYAISGNAQGYSCLGGGGVEQFLPRIHLSHDLAILLLNVCAKT